jgi:hypothetical protein
MQRFRMDEARVIVGVANGMSGRSLQLEDQECLIAHAAVPSNDAFDGRINRLDAAETDPVVAVGGDAVDVSQQEVSEALHFWQPLPA